MITIAHFHTLPPAILPTCKKVILRLSEHGDVIIETKTMFGYLSVILAHFGTVFGYQR